jgi:hypothetical protein
VRARNCDHTCQIPGGDRLQIGDNVCPFACVWKGDQNPTRLWSLRLKIEDGRPRVRGAKPPVVGHMSEKQLAHSIGIGVDHSAGQPCQHEV